MKRTLLGGLLVILGSLLATSPLQAADNPRVNIQTNVGTIVLELYPDKAPVTVENFLQYVRDGFFDGTIFHRVIPNFMIQGGGFTADYKKKATRDPIKNEADNGLKNVKGSVAMARTSNPQSATAQFFINVVDNPFLNYRTPTARGWGYAVFGQVVDGMDTVEKIRISKTGAGGPFRQDAPKSIIVMEKVTIIDDPKQTGQSK